MLFRSSFFFQSACSFSWGVHVFPELIYFVFYIICHFAQYFIWSITSTFSIFILSQPYNNIGSILIFININSIYINNINHVFVKERFLLYICTKTKKFVTVLTIFCIWHMRYTFFVMFTQKERTPQNINNISIWFCIPIICYTIDFFEWCRVSIFWVTKWTTI